MTKFTIAAFDPLGILVGSRERQITDLSEKWLSIADSYLSARGAVFKDVWQGNLAHITTQFTSAKGVALVNFFSGEFLVSSIALLSGENAMAEVAVLEMFVKSLRKSELMQHAAESGTPFQAVFDIASRPLMIVVPWGDERVSEQDRSLVQELSVHLSGAFFLRN